MARTTVKITGLKELDRALGQLPKATAKAALRRVLKQAGEPLAQKMRQNAPTHDMHLYESIDVSTRLSKRQALQHKAEGGRAFQEMFVGTNNPAGQQQEFGNENHPAQPWARPAWDAEKMPTLERITDSLWYEIEKSARQHAKKTARKK